MVNPFVLILLLAVAEIQLLVLAPVALKTIYASGVPAKFPRYGSIPYGSYVEGIVLLANSTCCTSSCSAPGFNTTHPFIFLVQRGGCSYATKAEFIGRKKAVGMIVYNTDSSQDKDSMSSSETYITSLPSALLSTYDGQRFLRGKDIVVNITFESTNLQDKVVVKAVMSLLPILDKYFLAALPALSDFRSVVTFELYFLLLFCESCAPLDSNCICNNLYCSLEDPVGAEVVREAIRQYCVLNLTSSNSFTPFTAYMLDWAYNCWYDPGQICESAFASSGVDFDDVQKCYLDTFVDGDEYGSDNYLLARLSRARAAMDVPFYPVYTLNDDALYGAETIANLHRGICAHLNFPHPSCSHFFCAPGCWPEMKVNLLCDAACNVEACGFDNGACLQPIYLVPPPPKPVGEQGKPNCTVNCTEPGGPEKGKPTPGEPPGPQGNPNTTCQNNTDVPESSDSFSNSTCRNATIIYPGIYNCSTSAGNCSYPASQPSFFLNDTVPEGCPCDIFALRSSVCNSVCSTSACHYQNWTCPCAPGCSLETLQNEVCDTDCNTLECHFDFFDCKEVQAPVNSPYTEYLDIRVIKKGDDDSWELKLAIGLVAGVLL